MILKIILHSVDNDIAVVNIESTTGKSASLEFTEPEPYDYKPKWYNSYWLGLLVKNSIYQLCKVFMLENLCADNVERSEVTITFIPEDMISSGQMMVHLSREIYDLSISHKMCQVIYMKDKVDSQEMILWKNHAEYTQYMTPVTQMIQSLEIEGTLNPNKGEANDVSLR